MDSVQQQPNPPVVPRPARRVCAVPPFPEIFREYGSFVWRTLRAHGVPEGYLDDACQEVFLTVFRRLDSFEGRSTLRTWIYGICIRVSMNCLRRAHMRREIPVDVLPESGGAAPQEHAVESRQLADRLVHVLSELAPDRPPSGQALAGS
jgi:RNA polymerase sigma-70 factor (ECF subfamily)